MDANYDPTDCGYEPGPGYTESENSPPPREPRPVTGDTVHISIATHFN